MNIKEDMHNISVDMLQNDGFNSIMNSTVNGTQVMLHRDFISDMRLEYPVDGWLKLGYLTEEYLNQINRHWFQFKPPTKQQHYLMASIYCVLMLCGVTGNSIVIYLFFSCRSLRTPMNLLVFNLAVSDLGMILKAPIFIYNSLHFGPALGKIGCSIYGVVGGLTGIASILTLSAIALDRYYAIAYPLSPRSRTTWGRAVRWIALLWLYSACLAFSPLTGVARPYVPEGYLTSCSFDYLSEDQATFIWVFFTLGWVIPFLLIVSCYGGICRAVVGVGPSRVGQEKEKRKTEVRLALVVVLVVGVWFTAWTPYATVAILGISGYGHHITPAASMLPALFCKTASCLDPFIYSFTHPRFRQELFRLICRKRYETRRKLTIQKTMVWRTDSYGKKQSIREQDDGIEIEEMVVVGEVNKNQSAPVKFNPINIQNNRLSLASKSDSIASSDSIESIETLANPVYQPPSWFVSPKICKTSSSFKNKSKSSFRSKRSIPYPELTY